MTVGIRTQFMREFNLTQLSKKGLRDPVNFPSIVYLLKQYLMQYTEERLQSNRLLFIPLSIKIAHKERGEPGELALGELIQSLEIDIKRAKIEGLRGIGYCHFLQTEHVEVDVCNWHFQCYLIGVSPDSPDGVLSTIKTTIPGLSEIAQPKEVIFNDNRPIIGHEINFDFLQEKKRLIRKTKQLKRSYSILRTASRELDELLAEVTPFSRLICIK